MSESQPRSIPSLREFGTRLLQAAGVSADEAAIVVESLLESNLRGHESHGIVRIPDYVKQMQRGELRADVPLRIVSETAVLLIADAQLGFGQVQMGRLVDQLVEKSLLMGIACGTLRNCGHVGRLGEWAERAGRRGCASLMTVNDNGVLRCVAPPGGKQPVISTNPLAIGVPTETDPLVLDISTSAVANGKVRVAMLAGQECPSGWLLDSEGRPTTNPAVRFTDPRGSILPMGGRDNGYKGFGLGLMVDLLTAGLSGGHCPPAPDGAVLANNVLFLVWNPALASGLDHFVAEGRKLIDFVRASPQVEPGETTRLPGDRSEALRRERLESGIPIDRGNWESLCRLAARLGVATP